MSRLIDADEVVRYFKSFIDAYGFDPKDARFSINDIEMNLLNIPTADKWIPCSERLPEDGEICLVCGKKGGMYVARIDRHGFWTITGTGKFATPIAWMPLPKPYEVEEE